VKQQYTPGLKSNAITVQNQQAYGLLEPSDWYVVRKSENGTAIPADWDSWRESIRTTYQSQVTMINACTTVPELQALYVYNDATPPVRPLPDFPTITKLMIYEIFNLIIEVSVISTIIVLLMGDSKNHPL
jgi:hypothetical protein